MNLAIKFFCIIATLNTICMLVIATCMFRLEERIKTDRLYVNIKGTNDPVKVEGDIFTTILSPITITGKDIITKVPNSTWQEGSYQPQYYNKVMGHEPIEIRLVK